VYIVTLVGKLTKIYYFFKRSERKENHNL